MEGFEGWGCLYTPSPQANEIRSCIGWKGSGVKTVRLAGPRRVTWGTRLCSRPIFYKELGCFLSEKSPGCGNVHWPPVPEALPVSMGKATRGQNSLSVRTKYICFQVQSTYYIISVSGIQVVMRQ